MPKIISNDKGGVWHTGYTMTDTGGYYDLEVTGMQTGCGLMQLYGFAICLKYGLEKKGAYESIIECFNSQLKTNLKDNDVGAIIATLGEDYYYNHHCINFLKDTGFEEVCEYTNYRHGSNTQKIFICKL